MGGPYGLLITPSEASRQQQKRDTHTSTPSQSKTSYEERENRSSAEFGQEKKRIALYVVYSSFLRVNPLFLVRLSLLTFVWDFFFR